MLPLNTSVTQMICTANHLTGFYMRARLAFNRLIYVQNVSNYSLTFKSFTKIPTHNDIKVLLAIIQSVYVK